MSERDVVQWLERLYAEDRAWEQNRDALVAGEHCLALARLIALGAGDVASDSEARHIESCRRCGGLLTHLRAAATERWPGWLRRLKPSARRTGFTVRALRFAPLRGAVDEAPPYFARIELRCGYTAVLSERNDSLFLELLHPDRSRAGRELVVHIGPSEDPSGDAEPFALRLRLDDLGKRGCYATAEVAPMVEVRRRCGPGSLAVAL